MMAPLIFLLFSLLMIIIALAWWGYYRMSIAFFAIFLIAALAVFAHHVTDHVPINL